MSDEYNAKLHKYTLVFKLGLLMVIFFIITLLVSVMVPFIFGTIASMVAIIVSTVLSLYGSQMVSHISRKEIDRIESLSTEEYLKEFGLTIKLTNDEKESTIDRLFNGETIEVPNGPYNFKGKTIKVVLS